MSNTSNNNCFLFCLSFFLPWLTSSFLAVLSITPIYFQVASNFVFSLREVLFIVIFPSVLPEIITALRMTIGIAWLVVVAAEMIAVQSGLGYLILDSRNALRMDYVMVGMIAIGLIGLVLDLVVTQMGKGKASVWKQIP